MGNFEEKHLLNKGYRLIDGIYVKANNILSTKNDIVARMPFKVNVKPLSVNQAWAGRRFKTPKYKQFEKDVMAKLVELKLPPPPFNIYLKFGFSSRSSDWDNSIKLCQDILAKKYNFNDKLIRKGTVEVEIVPKGSEYFIFDITTLK